MVLTAYIALSPVTGLSCHRRLRKLPLADLTPASGRQDHTTSPSAGRTLVRSAARVHRIPPRVRDDREPPLQRDGMCESIKLFLPNPEAKYFCREGWTRNRVLRPSGKSVGLSSSPLPLWERVARMRAA